MNQFSTPILKSLKSSSKRFKNPSKNHSNQILLSYSQLLNQHFKQLNNKRYNIKKKIVNPEVFTLQDNNLQQSSFKRSTYVFDRRQQKQSISHSTMTESFNLARKSLEFNKKNNLTQLLKKPLSLKKLKPNKKTEEQFQTEQLIQSKTPQLQKNILENLILNKKLVASTFQKKDLVGNLEMLKLQILKEKKRKAKLSTNISKIMNKIEEINSSLAKITSERIFIAEQTQEVIKENFLQNENNKKLKKMSEDNFQKIDNERQLIESLEKQIESKKLIHAENKTYLYEIKSIYKQQTKMLTKSQLCFEQLSAQRDKMFNVVQNSVSLVRK